MHGKTAQAQTQQQPGHGHISGHLATHRHTLALPVALGNGVGNQAQHRRVQRIVQMRHRFIGPVNRQRVLDQVVGANRQKVEIFEEQAHRQSRRRNLDHRPQTHRPMRLATAVQFVSGLVDQGQGLTNFAAMRQHGNEQIDFAMGCCTQNGPQLCEKHRRIGQTPADGAQTECGVEVGCVVACFVQWLVRPHIHCADGDWQTVHAINCMAIGFVLLVFARQITLAPHEQEFTAKQPHPHRACGDRSLGVLGHFNVGQELDFLAIQRGCRGVAQAGQAFTLQIALTLLEAIVSQDDG